MWLDVAITVSCAGGGLVCGWIMHAFSGLDHERWDEPDTVDSATAELTSQQMSQAANQLREFASVMAADVDAHQSRVEAVNKSLIKTGAETSADDVSDAVRQLIASNEAMQAQLNLARDRIELQTVQIESAERRAETDALTQVPNRRAFDRHLSERHQLGAGNAGTLALLDVDHFKNFNDVYGHRAGDEVLKVVANVLHSHLHVHGLVARFGGEEFAIVLDECDIEQGRALIEKARIAIGQRVIEFEGEQLRVAASAGVADLREKETAEAWLQRTDDGLYCSKEQGRDCGHWMEGTTPHRIESAGQLGESEGMQGSEERGESSLQNVSSVKSRVFASLPDEDSLQESFAEIRSRTKESVTMHLMAVVCSPGLGNSAIRSLLQVVRAPLRSVDRMGAIDNTTLLICLPSADHETALQLGDQICRSAESIGISSGEDGCPPLAVGLAEAKPSEDFQQVVSRAIEKAKDQQFASELA
ncbi:MAG: GGDEF domain-containing protein [Rubripirellula sp.]